MPNDTLVEQLTSIEFNQAREELRYQDNHIWGAGRFYVTSLVAIFGGIVALTGLKTIDPNTIKALIFSAALIWMCFGLLLFLRILAHMVHFDAWLIITDSVRKKIKERYKWLNVPKLLVNENEKRRRTPLGFRIRPWSWHTWLAVLIAVMNCLLAGLGAFALSEDPAVSLFHSWDRASLFAIAVMLVLQVVICLAYLRKQQTELETAKGPPSVPLCARTDNVGSIRRGSKSTAYALRFSRPRPTRATMSTS